MHPVNGSNPTSPMGPSSTSSASQQNLFELEWEISVLGTYLSVTGNKTDPQKLSQMQNNLHSGMVSPIDTQGALNQFINTLNAGMPEGQTAIPPFEFSSQNATKALEYQVINFEKYIHTLSEKNLIPFPAQNPIFKAATVLFTEVQQGKYEKTPQIGFQNLQNLIEQLKNYVGGNLQYPDIPKELRGNR